MQKNTSETKIKKVFAGKNITQKIHGKLNFGEAGVSLEQSKNGSENKCGITGTGVKINGNMICANCLIVKHI